MKVLWISPKLPYPPESGDKLRQFNLMRHLCSSVDISLVAFMLNQEEECHSENMRQYCRRVRTFYSPNPSYAKRLRSIVTTSTPYYVSRYQDFAATRHILDEVRTFQPDIVQIEHTYMADYLEKITPASRPPSVLTKHNIDADLAFQNYRLADGLVRKVFWWLEWKKMSVYEPYVDNLFSSLVVMSETDKAEILRRKQSPQCVDVVENGVDTVKFQPLPPVHDPVLLFIGALDYLPNQDAANYLCREIFPLLKKSFQSVKILLVGRKPSHEMLSLASEAIEVWGDVPEVEPYYRQASIAVVPLRAGSGSRLKILEAMALGRPVVSTRKGAEGLDIQAGKDFLAADDPAAFAASIAMLLNDPGLYRNVSLQARKTVEEKYDWSASARKMLAIYNKVRDFNTG
ncbi:MAG: glycosyltransferase [Desulfomonile sp.]|jgi:sugar transferase (PEP-CTERM/EpsH1 system associated)